MKQDIYRTLKNALIAQRDEIHKTNQWYEYNPEEAVFDLNADLRKRQLEELYAAEDWLDEYKKNS